MGTLEKNYVSTAVETASPAQLILLLYDGLLTSLYRAQKAIQAQQTPEAHRLLVKAQDIVTTLSNALDLKAGGEIAANLARIYDFLYRHLVDANLRKDAEAVRRAVDVVQPLRDAWEQGVLKKDPAGPTH